MEKIEWINKEFYILLSDAYKFIEIGASDSQKENLMAKASILYLAFALECGANSCLFSHPWKYRVLVNDIIT